MNNVYPFDDRETIEAEARQWLVRLDGDTPLSPEDTAALREWKDRSPTHRAELQRISAFWSDANVLTELAIPLSNQTDANHHASVVGRLYAWFSPFKRPGALVAMSLASIAVAALAIWFYPLSQGAANGIYGTAIGELQVKALTDGSVLHINTDSQVQVDYSEDVRKIRLLRGEAHFEVAKDTERPFEVYAGKSMIQAVGTAFSVLMKERDIRVTVTEGKVELATQIDNVMAARQENDTSVDMPDKSLKRPALVKIGSLSRGQSAIYDNAIGDVEKDVRNVESVAGKIHVESIPEQELKRQLSWREGYLVFNGDLLADVVSEVNRYSPVTIEIADPALRQLRIGGRFKVGDLEALYEVLEISFGVHVNRLDDQHIQLRPAQG